MNCTKFQEQAIDFAEGTANAETQNACTKHVNECTACQNFLAEVKKGLEVMALEKQETADPWLKERVIARMNSKQQREIHYRPAFLRLALVLLIALGTGLALNSIFSENTSEEISASTENSGNENDVLDSENTILSLNDQ